ncbi:hypothetical protein R75461_01144 [Paraburkholderia nemoris]|uniref:hypothetical protein n=1 Tax=Paraburkholderia nemoris TaxID=2793076 RepID=UPI001AFD68D3|nr:hypothetical protein [Paraburkholderia nemoris]CAE6712939.1 hypothetical protein R75461_01144 [Paraburkholderia nemoris]
MDHDTQAKQPMTLADQVEILKDARAGLHMWKMDTSGVDRMLAQHGVDVDTLPKHDYSKCDYSTQGAQNRGA